MNHIKQNIEQIKSIIPAQVKLIAVSKTKPVSDIEEAINAGQYIFGENKVQELVTKAGVIDKKAEWHMIGHLQTNKVKQLLSAVHLIHSVDSFKLAKEIDKEAQKINKMIPCLLQLYIAKEDTKFGFAEDELLAMLQMPEFYQLKNIEIHGLMGIASFTDNKKVIEEEFSKLRKMFERLKKEYFSENNIFKELSMGMSNDFQIAIEQGSTMIRIGSLIFGERYYPAKK
ncbi:MAG: YggS family pyridoxal phosphate-dependent enzyme [Bacteroidales bacterium]|jgi:pyridoxal phosphate enzyme (YggS family)|nr:YggS family pyridoxal phosphate-dependent enzyme [Bacteroidales bacterium]